MLCVLPHGRAQVLLSNQSSSVVSAAASRVLLEADSRAAECPLWTSLLFQQGRCAFTVASSHLWKVRRN